MRYFINDITRRRIAASVAVVAAGALVLTGCSSIGDSNSDGSQTSAESSDGSGSSTSQGSEAPETGGGDATETMTKPEGDAIYGGTVAINLHQNPPSLDPLATTSFATIDTIGLVYSRLITWKTGADVGYGEFVPAPDLAQSWDLSDDGLTYTFHLRDDVVWQDVAPVNGRAFTAADVLATFAAVQKDGIQSGLLDAVDTVKAPDDYTVVVTLKHKSGVMLQNLASPNLVILPSEAFDGGFDRSTTAIGTGPFVMKSYNPKASATYTRNPKYFATDSEGRQLPYLDGFEITYLTELQARINAFISKQDDIWFGPISTLKVKEIQGRVKDLVNIDTLASTQTMMFMNPKVKSLSDIRVRRAISLALSRCEMGPSVRGGGEVGGIVAPVLGKQALPEEQRKKMYCSPNPDKAKSLLAEAGYPDGLTLKMLVLNYGEEYLGGPQWFQQDLEKIGIKTEMNVVDTATGKSLATAGDFELAYLVMSPFSNAAEYFSNFYAPDAVRNYAKIDDPKLLDMMDEQAAEPDTEKRNALAHAIEKYVYENVLNPLPIWDYPLHNLTHNYVHDYYPVMAQGFPMMTRVWTTENN